jgi:hypothetical protein
MRRDNEFRASIAAGCTSPLDQRVRIAAHLEKPRGALSFAANKKHAPQVRGVRRPANGNELSGWVKRGSKFPFDNLDGTQSCPCVDERFDLEGLPQIVMLLGSAKQVRTHALDQLLLVHAWMVLNALENQSRDDGRVNSEFHVYLQ